MSWSIRLRLFGVVLILLQPQARAEMLEALAEQIGVSDDGCGDRYDPRVDYIPDKALL